MTTPFLVVFTDVVHDYTVPMKKISRTKGGHAAHKGEQHAQEWSENAPAEHDGRAVVVSSDN